MTLYLNSVNFAVVVTRQQPRKFILIGIDQQNNAVDLSSVTNTKIIISHATIRDAASVLATYLNVLNHNGPWLEWNITAALAESLPLGTFPVEMVVSEDNIEFEVAAQGTITFIDSLYKPA